jgi:ligand-binding sensor domain-containing protein
MPLKLPLFPLLIAACFTSCNGQQQPASHSTAVESSAAVGTVVSCVGADSSCNFQARDLLRDTKNNFWYITNGDGVFRDDGKTITRFTAKDGLCSNFVWKIDEGKDGKLWFKTRDGICYFDNNKFITPPVEDPTYPISFYNYLKDDLSVGHYYNGISLVRIELPFTSPIVNKSASPASYVVYCNTRDRKGNIWFGTQSAGVCCFDGKTYTWLNDKELGITVRCIFEDQQGIIWIGNNGGGLFRYDPVSGELHNFSREHQLHNPDPDNFGKAGTLSRVWTINKDLQGNLWIGTIDNGVWMYDGKKVRQYTTSYGLGIDNIWVIYNDRNEKLLFGTEGAGVYEINDDHSRFNKVKGAP